MERKNTNTLFFKVDIFMKHIYLYASEYHRCIMCYLNTLLILTQYGKMLYPSKLSFPQKKVKNHYTDTLIVITSGEYDGDKDNFHFRFQIEETSY